MKLRSVVFLACLIAVPLPGAAADDLVRVEVLVFLHQQGRFDAWPVDQLEDFSALTDPRERARQVALAASRGEIARSNPMAGETGAMQRSHDAPGSGVLLDPPGPALPELLVDDGQWSGPRRRARDRLNSSPAHEVLSATSWLQPLSRRSNAPAVRVRNDRPVITPEPGSAQLAFPIDLRLTAEEQPLAGIFQLDGSVRIRQRQFRHADLDLVWSQRRGGDRALSPANLPEFEIHRLQQSRPIQLGRVEYFDSPWIGVLILVQTWHPADP